MQGHARGLVAINSGNNNAVTSFASASDQIFEEEGPDTAPVMQVMDVDRVLDGPAIGAAGVISGQGTPTEDFVVRYRDGDGVFGAVMGEPVPATIERLGFFLI